MAQPVDQNSRLLANLEGLVQRLEAIETKVAVLDKRVVSLQKKDGMGLIMCTRHLMCRPPAFLEPFSFRLARAMNGIVGLKEAIKSENRIVRYIWIFLFAAASAATVFFTYQTAMEYFDENSYTKVSVYLV